MPEETTLGDFADASAGPAVAPGATLSYRPAGAPCDRCGADAAWRWTDGDALACSDCVEW